MKRYDQTKLPSYLTTKLYFIFKQFYFLSHSVYFHYLCHENCLFSFCKNSILGRSILHIIWTGNIAFFGYKEDSVEQKIHYRQVLLYIEISLYRY